jgi:hypothetical protein
MKNSGDGGPVGLLSATDCGFAVAGGMLGRGDDAVLLPEPNFFEMLSSRYLIGWCVAETCGSGG